MMQTTSSMVILMFGCSLTEVVVDGLKITRVVQGSTPHLPVPATIISALDKIEERSVEAKYANDNFLYEKALTHHPRVAKYFIERTAKIEDNDRAHSELSKLVAFVYLREALTKGNTKELREAFSSAQKALKLREYKAVRDLLKSDGGALEYHMTQKDKETEEMYENRTNAVLTDTAYYQTNVPFVVEFGHVIEKLMRNGKLSTEGSFKLQTNIKKQVLFLVKYENLLKAFLKERDQLLKAFPEAQQELELPGLMETQYGMEPFVKIESAWHRGAMDKYREDMQYDVNAARSNMFIEGVQDDVANARGHLRKLQAMRASRTDDISEDMTLSGSSANSSSTSIGGMTAKPVPVQAQ